MKLVGRHTEQERIRRWSTVAGGPITVWGPPGIGKSALVRESLPNWRVVDGRHLDADQLVRVGHQGRVVLDDVNPDTARLACLRTDVPLVLTSRVRLGIRDERIVELGPLEPRDALELFREALSYVGYRPSHAELDAIVPPLDGHPLAILEAARWFDVLGVKGLAIGSDADWPIRVTSSPPPHMRRLARALDGMWVRLEPCDRRALGTLSMIEGPIKLSFASALLGPDAFDRVKTLRDEGWLVLVRPGVVRVLRPMRACALRRAPPDPERVRRFVDARLASAATAWGDIEAYGHAVGVDYLDDLAFAVSHLARDPRVVPALSLLARLSPSRAVLDEVHAALEVDPMSVDLLRSKCRLHVLLGEFDCATEVISTLMNLGDDRVRSASHSILGAIAGRAHQCDEARRHYQRAIVLSEGAGDARGLAYALSNLAVFAHDIGSVDEARAHYTAAVRAWRGIGDKGQEALMMSNLAQTTAASGRYEAARGELSRVLSEIDADGTPLVRAAVHGTMGWVCFLANSVVEAECHLGRAQAILVGHDDVSARATLLAQWAATLAGLGRVAKALEVFDEAEDLLPRHMEFRERRLIGLLRGFADLALGYRDDAVVRLAAARRRTGDLPALTDVSDDARTAAFALEDRLVATPGPSLCIGHDAEWVRTPNGEPASLKPFATARKILLALAEERLVRPGTGLAVADLFAAGWPHERIAPTSMRNRVHVSLSKLRAVGLRRLLLRGEGGYLLDPQVPVLLVDRVAPPR